MPVARIGVTICIITLAWHSANAVHYDLFRALNTLIGIVAGLAVTFFVWPVRSPAELERTMRGVVSVSRDLLDAVARGEQNLRPLQASCMTAWPRSSRRFATRIASGARDIPRPSRRRASSRCSGSGVDVLSAALGKPSPDSLQALKQRADDLA